MKINAIINVRFNENVSKILVNSMIHKDTILCTYQDMLGTEIGRDFAFAQP